MFIIHNSCPHKTDTFVISKTLCCFFPSFSLQQFVALQTFNRHSIDKLPIEPSPPFFSSVENIPTSAASFNRQLLLLPLGAKLRPREIQVSKKVTLGELEKKIKWKVSQQLRANSSVYIRIARIIESITQAIPKS